MFSPAYGRERKAKHELKISGTVYSTSASYGGIERDNSHLMPIPMTKYKLYIVRVTAPDSIPVVAGSFTTDQHGLFSVSLPPGSYGFVTAGDIKSGLTKGQSLPQSRETNDGNNKINSAWECNRICPLVLNSNSVSKLVIANHLSFFCMDCP